MPTLRRSSFEPRIEIMPLIDVIFLLLTFFIYAMVLMVRVDLLPVELGALQSGERATPRPAVTVTLTLDGRFHVGREPGTLDEVMTKLGEAVAADQETAIYVALEAGEAAMDRAPRWQQLLDRLSAERLPFSLIGADAGTPDAGLQ